MGTLSRNDILDRDVRTLSINLKHAEMHIDTLLNPKSKNKEIKITEEDLKQIASHIHYAREKLMSSDGSTLRS